MSGGRKKAVPIQINLNDEDDDVVIDDDDNNDDFAFQSARTTRSSKKPPSSVSLNKKLISTASTRNAATVSSSSTASTTTPTRSRRRSNSGSGRKAPLTAILRPPPVAFEIDDDSSDSDKWNARPVAVAPAKSAVSAAKKKLAPPPAKSRPRVTVTLTPIDDDSDSDRGRLSNPTSRGAKRSASALFTDAPIQPLTKRAAAAAAESAMHAKAADDDDDGDDNSSPLKVTAIAATNDDDNDDDDFMSARDRRESSGGGGGGGSGAKKPPGKKKASRSPARTKEEIAFNARARQLAKAKPALMKALVAGEDDWLDGSLQSILDAAKPAPVEPEPIVAAAVAESSSQRTRSSKRKSPASGAAVVAAASGTATWAVKAPRPTSPVKFLGDIDSPPPAAVASPVVAHTSASPEQPQREPEPTPPFLPEFRDGIDVSVLLKSNASMLAIDSIVSGATKCARMDAFEQGGRARSSLARQVATGYFTAANVEAMLDALQQRYKTDDNVARFSGELNVMRVIGDVLLPELAIELLRRACGNKISHEEAVYFVEHPVVSAAARAKALAEARGAQSRVARRQK